ncbi:cobalt-precorrin-6A reductase [Gordonia shandongensis]|uniref:cobalt-precorrin-6A reductase n=1 Tax=Gordonia shandongensis TaxID=376351 RepID=UPI000422863E|nr:cobalt-precorrin-6A reductase [Gordonia shandongensis]
MSDRVRSRRVLILGGTGEARDLARLLAAADVPFVSSLAGRVRNPRLPVGEVRIGGFGGVDAMAEWLTDNGITDVVDATHPFAARITPHAVSASRTAGVRYLRLARPAWEQGAGDRWVRVPDIDAAADAVAVRGGRVMLTTGRQDVAAFAAIRDAWFLIRVVDEPDGAMPPQRIVLRSRGPYGIDDERRLLRDHRIELLVTKNSGGAMTAAKLRAAAELGIEVIVVDRPAEPEDVDTAGTAADAADAILDGPPVADGQYRRGV